MGAEQPSPGLRLTPLHPPLLLALLAMILAGDLLGAWSLAGPGPAVATRSSAGSFTDVQLHRDEVAFAHEPATYYARVIAEQRFRGYPLKPFAAVRPPALAFALAWLPGGEVSARLLIGALAAAVAGLWAIKLLEPIGAPGTAAAGLAMATGVVGAFTPNGYLMHECWAGLLIALSLALRPSGQGPSRRVLLGASLAAGLAAALVRELALPFLAVMVVMALAERRPREALLWCGAIGLCLLVLVAHALAVLRYTLPTDPGMDWVQLGGWRFLLAADRWNALMAPGTPLVAVLLPLALSGVLLWGGPVGRRLAFTVLGYAASFLAIGRPEDTYWGLMIAPLLPLGWVGAAATGARVLRGASLAPR